MLLNCTCKWANLNAILSQAYVIIYDKFYGGLQNSEFNNDLQVFTGMQTLWIECHGNDLIYAKIFM